MIKEILNSIQPHIRDRLSLWRDGIAQFEIFIDQVREEIEAEYQVPDGTDEEDTAAIRKDKLSAIGLFETAHTGIHQRRLEELI